MPFDVQSLSANEFDNLIHEVFEAIASDSSKAQHRMEALREGTAKPSGLSADEVLKLYRAKLEAAIANIDKYL